MADERGPGGSEDRATATLLVAGDVSATGRVEEPLSGGAAVPVWGDLGPIVRAADFSIVNVECPLTRRPEPIRKVGPHLWGPPEAAGGIRAAGFDAAGLANNHILDAGPLGVMDTVAACEGAGLAWVGAGRDLTQATQPLSTTVNGLQLCVLAVAENEFSTTRGTAPGAWPFDVIDNSRQIETASRSSDFVLVTVHGGVESYALPTPALQKACRFFVERGADAVVCHHSHVAGGYEWYRDRPIVYGTGNLLFDWGDRAEEEWCLGYAVSLTITPHRVEELRLVPYRQDAAVPLVSLLVGEEREAFLDHIASLSATLLDPEELDAAWGDLCRRRIPATLGGLLCLTKTERRLLSRGLLPTVWLRVSGDRLARLQNLFTCESHYERAKRALLELSAGRNRDAH